MSAPDLLPGRPGRREAGWGEALPADRKAAGPTVLPGPSLPELLDGLRCVVQTSCPRAYPALGCVPLGAGIVVRLRPGRSALWEGWILLSRRHHQTAEQRRRFRSRWTSLSLRPGRTPQRCCAASSFCAGPQTGHTRAREPQGWVPSQHRPRQCGALEAAGSTCATVSGAETARRRWAPGGGWQWAVIGGGQVPQVSSGYTGHAASRSAAEAPCSLTACGAFSPAP